VKQDIDGELSHRRQVRMRRPVVVVFTASLLLCCQGKPDRWSGFVYPDKQNLTVHIHIGEFPSLEQCRDAARLKLKQLFTEGCSSPTQNSERRRCSEDPLVLGDYECGRNCESRGSGLSVCAETVR